MLTTYLYYKIAKNPETRIDKELLSIFEKEITIKHAFSESMIPILMPIAAVCIYRYFYKNIVEQWHKNKHGW